VGILIGGVWEGRMLRLRQVSREEDSGIGILEMNRMKIGIMVDFSFRSRLVVPARTCMEIIYVYINYNWGMDLNDNVAVCIGSPWFVR
jgi:hypothetical protein